MKFFDRFKSDIDTDAGGEKPKTIAADMPAPEAPAKQEVDASSGYFSRLKTGLKRTGSSFSSGMGSLFLGKKAIDDELLEELETQLLIADVGIEATTAITDNLARQVSANSYLMRMHSIKHYKKNWSAY